jgi:uncharacterized protein (TIRG00374 family)
MPALLFSKTSSSKHISKRTVLVIASFVVIFALLYVVIPAVGKFGDTYSLLRHADPINLIAAFLVAAATYALAALTYQFLALHPLRYGRTVVMQVASSFANRILPAGTGGLALNIQYLRKSRHSTGEASVVVVMNNALGFTANMIVLVVLLVMTPGSAVYLHVPAHTFKHLALYVLLGTGTTIVGLILLHNFFHLGRFLKPLTKSLVYYKKQPQLLVEGLMSSIGLSLLYALVLYYAAHSLGVHISVAQAFIAMTVSTTATVLLPTPGGIGGAEAGVVTALVALHVSSPLSLAVALLYRVFTFWLPLVAGAMVFRYNLRFLTHSRPE